MPSPFPACRRSLCILVGFAAALCLVLSTESAAADARPNFLIVTVDDMNCDSVGAFGCRLPGTTPNIDQLAAEGLRYEFAHVQTASCFPSRNVMFSGRYSHNTGVEGFYQVKDASYPHLVDVMKAAGYFVAIRGKVPHSTPYQPYGWDADLSTLDGKSLHIKDPQSYYASTRRGIELAREAGKPFCLNINISDPHKPFYAMSGRGEVVTDPYVPSRVFRADEVPIPGFLFDHPGVRRELAHYYSSVRRADDCVAKVMAALEESGHSSTTVVMFLSDHGMPLPFAKTAAWHHSTRTPWIVRWPGVTPAGSVDRTHMISAVDLLPTVLEIAGIEPPPGFDGRSFAPTLKGQKQDGREMIFKFHNENSGRNRSPMRGVESRRFGYIFNPWSDGRRIFRTATTGTITYRTMRQLAQTDEKMAARLHFFDHRVLEEFYDYQHDPDALHNLIDDPRYAEEIERHRAALRQFMLTSRDPLLTVFDKRDDASFVSAYVDQVQAEANARGRSAGARGKAKRNNSNRKLFQLKTPERAARGQALEVVIEYRIPADLGEQSFHVTLRDGAGKRLERQVKAASGSGRLTVTFQVPVGSDSDTLSVAAFVGKDFPSNLQYQVSGPIRVRKP